MNEICFNFFIKKYIGKKVVYLRSFPIKDKLFFENFLLYNSLKSELLSLLLLRQCFHQAKNYFFIFLKNFFVNIIFT